MFEVHKQCIKYIRYVTLANGENFRKYAVTAQHWITRVTFEIILFLRHTGRRVLGLKAHSDIL